MLIKSSLAVMLSLALIAGAGRVAHAETTPDSDLVARLHFVGTSQMGASTNAEKWNEIRLLPESTKLWEEIVQKLTTTPLRIAQKHRPELTNDHAALIRPLVEDAFSSETYIELRGASNAWPEMMFAIRLDSKRVQTWRDTLATVFTDWTGIPVTDIKAEGFKGWELKKHHNPNVVRCFPAGDWLVFGWGQDDLLLQSSLLKKIKDQKRPIEIAKNYWLDVWVDWPGFTKFHPLPVPVDLPRMQLTVENRAEYLRPQLTMMFPQPLKMEIEPWHFPTNLVHDPISSITFARGIAPLLKKFVGTNLNGAVPPNQIVLWALQKIPIATYAALSVKDASNYLAQVAPNLVSMINSNMVDHAQAGEAVLAPDNSISLHGLPLLAPFLKAQTEPEGDYLVTGLFSIPPFTNSPPWQNIRNSLAQEKMVYYDWELNAERVDHWKLLNQLYIMLSSKNLPAADAPGQKWLMAIKPKLQNCVTVATLTMPNQLTFVRNGKMGLTGFELNQLALWFDAPNFPLDNKAESQIGMDLRGMALPKK